MDDLEIALNLIGHIVEPCQDPISGHRIRRSFYIELAQDVLRGGMFDQTARDLLGATIEVYSK